MNEVKIKNFRLSFFARGVVLACLLLGWAATAHAVELVWRKADSPRIVSEPLTISADNTLIIEPGVEVRATEYQIQECFCCKPLIIN